jgi:hypothetical protein
MARYSPTKVTLETPMSKSRLGSLTPYSHGDMDAMQSPTIGATFIRDEIFDEAKLRDVLVQRRITRDGMSWDRLPVSVRREMEGIRDLYASAAASGHTEVKHINLYHYNYLNVSIIMFRLLFVSQCSYFSFLFLYFNMPVG